MRPLSLTTAALLLAAAACRTAPARAPSPAASLPSLWIILAESNGMSIAIDAPSVVHLDQSRYRATVDTRFPRPQELLGKRFVTSRKVSDFDCDRRMTRIHSFTMLDAKGREVSRAAYPAPYAAAFRAVVPATLTEAEYVQVCRYVALTRQFM